MSEEAKETRADGEWFAYDPTEDYYGSDHPSVTFHDTIDAAVEKLRYAEGGAYGRVLGRNADGSFYKPAPPEPEWWWPKWHEGNSVDIEFDLRPTQHSHLALDWLRLKRLAGELSEEAE